MVINNLKKMRIACVSSFHPRECGIATFTYDLTNAIDELELLAPSAVVAVNEPEATYNYGEQVKFH